MEIVRIYVRWAEYFKCLTDEEVGRLFKGILLYAKDGGQIELNEKENSVFMLIKDDIDLQREGKFTSGKYHWNWKGGITPKNQQERNSKECHEWRKAVFLRDSFTCQICGQVGGRLNAHHIRPWASNADLRYEVINGITLCEKCHREVHRKKIKCRNMSRFIMTGRGLQKP